MARVELSDYFEVLMALLEAFEKYPRGAMWVGGLLALAIICYTFVSVYKSKILKIEQAFNELARKEGRGEIARSWAAKSLLRRVRQRLARLRSRVSMRILTGPSVLI